MPTLDYLRSEIERMRVQAGRQRKDILPSNEPVSRPTRLRSCFGGVAQDAVMSDLPRVVSLPIERREEPNE